MGLSPSSSPSISPISQATALSEIISPVKGIMFSAKHYMLFYDWIRILCQLRDANFSC